MIIKLIIFGLAALPLLVYKNLYEGPKVYLFLVLCILVCLHLIFRYVKGGKKIIFAKADGYYWGWVLTLALSGIMSEDFAQAVFGGSYRFQGVIFFAGIWFVGKFIALLDPKDRNLLGKLIAAAVIFEAVLVFGQLAFGMLYFGRPLGTLGEPNAVGGFLAIGVYFLSLHFSSRFSWLAAIAVLITRSRTAFLALGVWMFLLAKKIGRKAAPLLLAAFALSFFGVFYLSLGRVEDTVENRSVIWKFAIDAVTQKPWSGWGPESGEGVFEKLFLEKKGIILDGLMIDRAHNLFLDLSMWSGVIGLSLFSLWFVEVFKRSDAQKRTALLAFLTYAFFQPLSVVHWVMLITIINI